MHQGTWRRGFTAVMLMGLGLAVPSWARALEAPIFVLNSLDATVSVIDPANHTETKRLDLGKEPHHVYLSPDERSLLVGLTGDSVVEAYDVSQAPPRLIKRIRTGAGAHAFRAWGDQRHLLVSNRVANTISRLDMQTLEVVDTYPAPGGPDCMELSADRKTLMATSRWARKLSFIDVASKTVVRQIKVGRSPHGVWTLDHVARR